MYVNFDPFQIREQTHHFLLKVFRGTAGSKGEPIEIVSSPRSKKCGQQF